MDTLNSNSRVSPVSIVIEGLDGVGKSTVAMELSKKLNGILINTPPDTIKPFRSWFDSKDEVTKRAYYMVGNFLAAEDLKNIILSGKSVVLDRYYASTMAYQLAKLGELEPAGSIVYDWPVDLYRPKYMICLRLSEEDRIRRRASRLDVPETIEEEILRNNAILSSRINDAYERLGCYMLDILTSDSCDDIINKILMIISN